MSLELLPGADGAELLVRITGTLDENTAFASIVPPSRRLDVDFGGVTRCNSMGVMRWTRFLKSMAPTLVIRLHRCPQVLVKQFNLYRAFLDHPGLVVESFDVAMACARCDAGKSVLVEGAADAAAVKIPTGTCACGGTLELDGARETQLRFLDRRPT